MTDLERQVNDVLTKLDIEIAEMLEGLRLRDVEKLQNRQKYEVYMYKAGEDAKTRKFLESLDCNARNFYISYTIFVTLAIIAIFLK